jgi:predicted acetyltransferase
MAAIEIRPFSGEPRVFLEAVELAFGEQLRDEDAADWARLLEADRTLAAYDGDEVVGNAAVISFNLTVPGGVVPTAGVSMVGVRPTHRRRGLLRALMRRQLDDIHERGEPLAALWASEGGIYQRFGYGLASLHAEIKVDTQRTAFRRPHAPSGSVRIVSAGEARKAAPAVFDAVRESRPGYFTRSDAFWDVEIFRDAEHQRRGASAKFWVLHATDGRTDGYAWYRIRGEWESDGSRSELRVGELIAQNVGAHLDLWRYLFDVDLIAKVNAWNLPPDDPILLTILEPRRLNLSLGDALWLRLVDLPAALGARGYRADGEITLEVTDEFCPWNAARWTLRADGGVASAVPASVEPDLQLDTTDLAAAYLGAFTFTQLAAAGRVRECRPGALRAADDLFRTDIAPFCPAVF